MSDQTAIDPTGHQLPDRTYSIDACAPRCPWCRDEITDLAIPIDALLSAHEGSHLTGKGNWLLKRREFTGAETECPRCGRGLLVKFVADSEERMVVIAPVRSPADCRFIAERMGLF